MPNIKLRFMNESNDVNNSDVVIFQKNEDQEYNGPTIAWKVIQNCATGWEHEFDYSSETKISAIDSYGNRLSVPIIAQNGQAFEVYSGVSGNEIKFKGPGKSPNEIELQNNLIEGSIDATYYRSNNIIAKKTGVSPGQKAVFQFSPTLWIGVASQIEEGDIIAPAVLNGFNTRLRLTGVVSADIIMTGGGTGNSASPFYFELANIKYA